VTASNVLSDSTVLVATLHLPATVQLATSAPLANRQQLIPIFTCLVIVLEASALQATTARLVLFPPRPAPKENTQTMLLVKIFFRVQTVYQVITATSRVSHRRSSKPETRSVTLDTTAYWQQPCLTLVILQEASAQQVTTAHHNPLQKLLAPLDITRRELAPTNARTALRDTTARAKEIQLQYSAIPATVQKIVFSQVFAQTACSATQLFS
jgi:hypothetical protein